MISLSRKLAAGAAACGFLLTAHAGDAAAVAIPYTDFNAFQGAVSALTTESFDAAPWTPVGIKAQGLSSLGVSWTTANDLFGFGGSHSGTTAITSLDGSSADIFDWIEAALPDGITAVGGWVTSFNMAHNTTLLAYDSLDNLLGSVSLANTGRAYAFLGLTTETAIAKVRIASTGVTNPIGDDFALDDFSFGVGGALIAVPSPSSLVLFGAALAALLAGAPGSRARRSAGAHDTLDRRTLADIGIDHGAGLSAARHVGVDRLRRPPHA